MNVLIMLVVIVIVCDAAKYTTRDEKGKYISNKTKYKNGKYAHDNSGQYNHDSSGQYTSDDSGKYYHDPSGQYEPDDSGQYVPDYSGQYYPDYSGQYIPDDSGQYTHDDSGDYTEGGERSRVRQKRSTPVKRFSPFDRVFYRPPNPLTYYPPSFPDKFVARPLLDLDPPFYNSFATSNEINSFDPEPFSFQQTSQKLLPLQASDVNKLKPSQAVEKLTSAQINDSKKLNLISATNNTRLFTASRRPKPFPKLTIPPFRNNNGSGFLIHYNKANRSHLVYNFSPAHNVSQVIRPQKI